MIDAELRKLAMDMAVRSSTTGTHSSDVVDRAQAYYNFMKSTPTPTT